MYQNLFEKVYKFITCSPLEYVTAVSVIYKVIEVVPWIQREVLREIINKVIDAAINMYSRRTAQQKLLKIPLQVSY